MIAYSTLEKENEYLKECLYEDCSCAYMANDIVEKAPLNIDEITEENHVLKVLLKEKCSCKGE